MLRILLIVLALGSIGHAEEHVATLYIQYDGSPNWNDSVQELVDHLRVAGAHQVKWELAQRDVGLTKEGYVIRNLEWHITVYWSSEIKDDEPRIYARETAEEIVAAAKLAQEPQLPVGVAMSGPRSGPKLAVTVNGKKKTGYLSDISGAWYRPQKYSVGSNSTAALCVLLGTDAESLKDLDHETKTKIASSLIAYWNSGGDLFCGGSK